MTNIEALTNLCTSIVNTFYPDSAVLRFALFNEGVDADAQAQPKDALLFRCAVRLVRGYVEASRSEGSISVSVQAEAVEKSLAHWCAIYGLDADDVLGDASSTIQDATTLW